MSGILQLYNTAVPKPLTHTLKIDQFLEVPITVATLVALNRTEQLPFHLGRALENGIRKDEIIELITHLAFYSGWPTAMSAVLLAKKVFQEDEQ